MNRMNNQFLSNENTRAYKNYQRILPFFRELIFHMDNVLNLIEKKYAIFYLKF